MNKGEQDVWHCFSQMREFYRNTPIILNRAEGHYFYDVKNKKYYDGVSTLLNASFGHNRSELMEAIYTQARKLDVTSLFNAGNDISQQYFDRLKLYLPPNLNKVFYTNSGSEAVETAYKICRQYHWLVGDEKRTKFISMKGAYHGSNLLANYITAASSINRGMEKIIDQELFFVVDIPDSYDETDATENELVVDRLHSLESMIIDQGPETFSSIILEVVQLSNGAYPLPKLFLEGVQNLCRKYGLLFIIDEIATGFGRTGSMFAFGTYDLKPDIITLGKAINNGLIPMGAVVVSEHIFNAFLGEKDEDKELLHGYTTSGHPIACAAALATLDLMENTSILECVNELGSNLKTSLMPLLNYEFVKCISGNGMMLALRFKPGYRVAMSEKWGISHILDSKLKQRGFLFYPDDEDTLIIAPPLTSSREEIVSLVDTVLSTIEILSKGVVRK
ncbi:aspartate aminotransferase family protein [Paenibacillus albiflavus]|uniref:Aspartate aminotransferase family protein n=1 Tax=Paenibacillus albiflavus TaxID=2545760 RepID=A0A4R4ECN9_9BACL|nr:aminotransferase class III-fold pyridoxal phosphate-dependent enzyme [Paenibacillus albiflavus]TCZ77167.1 aspartate aminotransferase family protein [Paenibacillus albiflavus]